MAVRVAIVTRSSGTRIDGDVRRNDPVRALDDGIRLATFSHITAFGQMKRVPVIVVVVAGLACLAPFRAAAQLPPLDAVQASSPPGTPPASPRYDSLPRLPGAGSLLVWPGALRDEQPGPGTLPGVRAVAGRGTFPKWTLVGAALGGALFAGYAIAAGADGGLLPGTRERLIFGGFVGAGALIGYAADSK